MCMCWTASLIWHIKGGEMEARFRSLFILYPWETKKNEKLCRFCTDEENKFFWRNRLDSIELFSSFFCVGAWECDWRWSAIFSLPIFFTQRSSLINLPIYECTMIEQRAFSSLLCSLLFFVKRAETRPSYAKKLIQVPQEGWEIRQM